MTYQQAYDIILETLDKSGEIIVEGICEHPHKYIKEEERYYEVINVKGQREYKKELVVLTAGILTVASHIAIHSSSSNFNNN